MPPAIAPLAIWRGNQSLRFFVVDFGCRRLTRLENRQGATLREFESHPLRQNEAVGSTKSPGAILDARSAPAGRGPGWPESLSPSPPKRSRGFDKIAWSDFGRRGEAATVP